MLSQARSENIKQEHQVGSLYDCIGELQQQAYAQRLELQDAHQGYVESRREEVRMPEELCMKEKVTEIRRMRELGELKRAQELRLDEVSVQKLGENHETRQKLTSQLQEMQDQTNSMTDIQENFKKWNQITVEDCLTFPVNLQ